MSDVAAVWVVQERCGWRLARWAMATQRVYATRSAAMSAARELLHARGDAHPHVQTIRASGGLVTYRVGRRHRLVVIAQCLVVSR